jgi:hypothetical protein
MVDRKILLTVFSLLFLLVIPFVNATSVTNCQLITTADTYILTNNIDANAPPSIITTACFEISASNVVLDLNDYTITSYNNSALDDCIRINDNLANITIKNGVIQNFTKADTGVGIHSYGGWDNGNINIIITDVKLLNNNYGLFLSNVSNSQIKVAIDQPLGKKGLYGWFISNSTFNVFTRTSTYGAIFDNMSFSIVSGHFDTDVIVAENQTTFIGWFVGSYDIFHLLPPSVTTTTILTQSKGIGLICRNCSNNVFKDISALGLIQGIDLTAYSTNNILGRIDLPLSGKYTGGKFGGIWLDTDAKYNQLCEIHGIIIDNCNQLLISSTCSGKYNEFFDTCENVFNPSSYGQQQSISNLYLIPLLPAIQSDYYPIMAFMTTPFFLIMLVLCMISGYIAINTKPIYGLYSLMFLVVIFTSISFFTIWIGFIFVVIMAFMIIQYQKRQEISETHE